MNCNFKRVGLFVVVLAAGVLFGFVVTYFGVTDQKKAAILEKLIQEADDVNIRKLIHTIDAKNIRENLK